MNLTAEYVRSLIDYDPDTGICTWKPRPREMFATDRAFSTWNSRYARIRAGSKKVRSDGYCIRHIRINKRSRREHRIIWLIMTGEQPPEQIDHINGDATDNRWNNLRDASGKNNLNMSKYRNNTSGVTGVSWYEPSGKWKASVTTNGKLKHLGYFGSVEEAADIAKQARRDLGFSERHGNDRVYREQP